MPFPYDDPENDRERINYLPYFALGNPGNILNGNFFPGVNDVPFVPPFFMMGLDDDDERNLRR